MIATTLDNDLVDFFDHLDHVLSSEFILRWKFKYSSKFLKNFQIKLLQALDKNKPLKRSTLFNYLTKRCKYGEEQTLNFFRTIDLDLLYPLVLHK